MNKIVMVLAVLAAFVSNASAQEATKPATPTWTDVQRACGTEYREADKASRPTWQEFLNECKGRKGFVPKKAARGDFRLPDVAKQ